MVELTGAELAVNQLGRQVEMQIDNSQIAELVTSGRYLPSVGMFRGTHFRAERGSGCYHLRVGDTAAYLHWDGFDPRRAPVRHVAETPVLLFGAMAAALTATAFLAAVAGVVMAGRKKG